MPAGIRLFRADDAAVLKRLIRASVEQLGPIGYSDPQVSAWAARCPPAPFFSERVAAGAIIWVAVDKADLPVAYAMMETCGHLDHLYCHPGHARQGHGARLLAVAEAAAQDWGLNRLFTEASEVARPVFERAGYRLIERRDFDIAGVPIHNYAMDKRLA